MEQVNPSRCSGKKDILRYAPDRREAVESVDGSVTPYARTLKNRNDHIGGSG